MQGIPPQRALLYKDLPFSSPVSLLVGVEHCWPPLPQCSVLTIP